MPRGVYSETGSEEEPNRERGQFHCVRKEERCSVYRHERRRIEEKSYGRKSVRCADSICCEVSVSRTGSEALQGSVRHPAR